MAARIRIAVSGFAQSALCGIDLITNPSWHSPPVTFQPCATFVPNAALVRPNRPLSNVCAYAVTDRPLRHRACFCNVLGRLADLSCDIRLRRRESAGSFTCLKTFSDRVPCRHLILLRPLDLRVHWHPAARS